MAQTDAVVVEDELAVKLDTSLVFARGDYGLAEDTDVLIAMAMPTFEGNGWRLQGTIPYIRLDGPASVVGGTGTGAESRSESGLGDLSVTLARSFMLAEG